MRYHLMLIRMATIKKSTNNKCWREYGEKGKLLVMNHSGLQTAAEPIVSW